jgi:dGTPase
MTEILGHFRHNEQSVRVVEFLEREGRGLNLAEQVRDGILRHSKVREDVSAKGWGVASTLEGQIVKLADSIAYLAHDIDDAIRANIISLDDIPSEFVEAFGTTTGDRIEALVSDIVDYNWRIATGDGATWKDAVGNGMAIGISPPTLELFNGLREFMFSNVYTASDAKVDNPKTMFVIHALFEHFCKHPEQMPAEFQENPRDEPMERRVADYIAGMTDRYAVKAFEEVYVPREWAVYS